MLGFLSGTRPQEIILILLVVLVLFGARKLPEIGKGLGRGVKEFREGVKGLSDDVEEGMQDDATSASTSEPRETPPTP